MDRDGIAVLKMLVRRATLIDKWRARTRPGHWLNEAKQTITEWETPYTSGNPWPMRDYPCRAKVSE